MSAAQDRADSMACNSVEVSAMAGTAFCLSSWYASQLVARDSFTGNRSWGPNSVVSRWHSKHPSKIAACSPESPSRETSSTVSVDVTTVTILLGPPGGSNLLPNKVLKSVASRADKMYGWDSAFRPPLSGFRRAVTSHPSRTFQPRRSRVGRPGPRPHRLRDSPDTGEPRTGARRDRHPRPGPVDESAAAGWAFCRPRRASQATISARAVSPHANPGHAAHQIEVGTPSMRVGGHIQIVAICAPLRWSRRRPAATAMGRGAARNWETGGARGRACDPPSMRTPRESVRSGSAAATGSVRSRRRAKSGHMERGR